MATVRAPDTHRREAERADLRPQGDGQDGVRLELLDALERMERTEDGWVEKVAHPAHGNMDHRVQVRLDRLGVPEGAVYPNVRLAPTGTACGTPRTSWSCCRRIRCSRRRARRLPGVPDLVIEILSRTTAERDRGEKVRNYAARGVPHYWIADPDTQTVWALRLEDGRYVEAWVRPLAEVKLPWSPAPSPEGGC